VQGSETTLLSVSVLTEEVEEQAEYHDLAQSQLTESNMHPAAASQSKLCELGSLVLTNMVRDHGQ
jgi:hypothetical protein